MTPDTGLGRNMIKTRSPERTIGLLACALCPLTELSLRMVYGYGVSTGLYLCFGLVHLAVLVVTLIAAFGGSVVLLSACVKRTFRRDHLVIPTCAVLSLVITFFAFLHFPQVQRYGARIRIASLGGDAFVTKLRNDALYVASLNLPPSDQNGTLDVKPMPSSFQQLGVRFVMISTYEHQKYVLLLSDRPHRSKWYILPRGEKEQTYANGVAPGVYRQ
jgi:hypothetical protein